MASNDENGARTFPVSTKLSAKEKARLDAHCALYGLSPAAVLRDRLFDRPLPTSPLDHVASQILLATHAVRLASKDGGTEVVETGKQLIQLTQELIAAIRGQE